MDVGLLLLLRGVHDRRDHHRVLRNCLQLQLRFTHLSHVGILNVIKMQVLQRHKIYIFKCLTLYFVVLSIDTDCGSGEMIPVE